MTACLKRSPARDVEELLRPAPRRSDDLAREDCAAGGNLDAKVLRRELLRPHRLAVEAARRVRRLGSPVEHDVRQQVVLGETALDVAAAVAPRAELLDD